VAGVRNVVVRVDGADVGQTQGRLNLSHLRPGEHVLEIEASDGDGRTARVQKRFNYEPSAAALAPLVGSLKLKNGDAKALKEQLSMLARDARTPNRFGDMIHLLDRHRNELHAGDYDVLRAVVSWVAEHDGEKKVVRVLAEPPYFEPREVTVKQGGSVTWLYGDDGGHGGNHVLQQIRIPSLGEQSALLRGGEQYTVRFQATGRFPVENTKKSDAAGVVNVIQ
jgi:plastocyanin